MPVNFDKKFIFIHIPKTAGQSIYQAIGIEKHPCNYWGYRGAFEYSHLTAKELRNAMGNRDFDIFEKIVVTRNPFDRLVSEYFYKRIGSDNRLLSARDISFKEFVIKLSTISLPDYPQWERAHFTPQHEFVFDGMHMLVDKVFRYEEFDKIREYVRTKFNAEIPHINRSKHKHYTEYYDDETRKLVEGMYARDFLTFNYLDK